MIGLYGHIYEISEFVSKHPGEGIQNTYLMDYNKKDATEDFIRYHTTNEADEMLINAKKDGYDEETGIYYICPYFFKKKIPKYFHFFSKDSYGLEYMKNKDNLSFILRRNNSDIDNSLCIIYKNNIGEIKQLKITRNSEKLWYITCENINDFKYTENIYYNIIEDVIQKIMIDNDYIGV